MDNHINADTDTRLDKVLGSFCRNAGEDLAHHNLRAYGTASGLSQLHGLSDES